MLTTVLDLCAVALVVLGIALLSIPAALIVAGVGIGAISWQMGDR